MDFWKRASSVGFSIPVRKESDRTCFEGTRCAVLDGQGVAADLVEQCKKLVVGRTVPHLVVILVGDDPASHIYVRNKANTFLKAGFSSKTLQFGSGEHTTESLEALIDDLNKDSGVHGILVQMPLPKHINSQRVLHRIDPSKDVDGFLPLNAGLLATGALDHAFLPCTPFGVMVLLAAYGVLLRGKRAVVVGRSNVVGKPMSLLLLGADATVTVVHRYTAEMTEILKSADVVVAAVGQPELVTSAQVKPGAVVVDVGINRVDGRVVGDVSRAVTEFAQALSPVPKGVGPMTIAMLCVNTALAAWTKR